MLVEIIWIVVIAFPMILSSKSFFIVDGADCQSQHNWSWPVSGSMLTNHGAQSHPSVAELQYTSPIVKSAAPIVRGFDRRARVIAGGMQLLMIDVLH